MRASGAPYVPATLRIPDVRALACEIDSTRAPVSLTPQDHSAAALVTSLASPGFAVAHGGAYTHAAGEHRVCGHPDDERVHGAIERDDGHGHCHGEERAQDVPAASRLRERSAKGAVGFNLRAPMVRARQLDGSEFRLSKQRGKVVLLYFWPTDCAPSASARPGLNEVVSTYGSAVVWAARAKDTSRADIDTLLKKAPMSGVVLYSDASSCRVYNPDVATPVFIIIDAKGVVRFCATGALSIDAVRAKLRELLGR